jgi:hypothetical protein
MIEYEALSYTWGDESCPQQITLNNRTFEVTRNLEAALRHLRHQYLPRRLWIDAICINQANDIEKGYQIQQMQHVFRHARPVIVWLGEATADSDLALTFARQFHDRFLSHTRQGFENEELQDYPNFQEIEAKLKCFMKSEYISSWVALHSLFSRPWWSRAWIIQEVLMAKQLQLLCGKKSIAWQIISVAIFTTVPISFKTVQIINFSTNPHSTLPPLHRHQRKRLWYLVTNRLQRLTSDTRVYSLSDIEEGYLKACQLALCKFPHDKIYSILGLCSPLASTVMHPDYAQPVQKVYSQVVKLFAEGIGSLDILVYSQHSDSVFDLPSWTPDWRQRPRMFPYTNEVSKSKSEWHFVAMRRFPSVFSEDLLLMAVSGIRYGLIIRTKLEVEFIPGIRVEERSEYRDETGVSSSVPLERKWYFGDNVEEQIHRLIEEFPSDSEGWQPFRRSSTLLSIFVLQEPSLLHEAKVLRPAFWKRPFSEQKSFDEAYSELHSRTYCRTLSRIDKGDLCLAPFWVQEGDIVCQIIGCTVPVILRRRGDGYTFVGDCYVWAKMDGEMIELLEHAMESEAGLERFVLA